MRSVRNKLPVILEVEETKILLDIPNKRYPTVVNGKNSKDRDLIIPGYALELLTNWIAIRFESKYFFSTLDGSTVITRYIQGMVGRYKGNRSRATLGTICPILARGASSSLISVTVLGFTPSGRTLGADHHIGARCMATR